MSFHKNIFINCPFDKEYKPILNSIFFCITYLDFNPMLSETYNSADSRIENIINLLSSSKYSIHDLSRMESSKKNELARFNMPFELGMDIGCKKFGSENHNSKSLLILDKEKYRYKRAISDLSGNDIGYHDNSPEKALRQVRNWIYRIEETPIPSPNKIWRLYNEFMGDFYEIAESDELSQEDKEEMPWDEFKYYIKNWVEGREHFE